MDLFNYIDVSVERVINAIMANKKIHQVNAY